MVTNCSKVEEERMISVCMATYNGEAYIKEQVDSILKNLSNTDELVISDDGSTDGTLQILDDYQDPRIKIFRGPHAGFVKNFENAIKHSKGQYIFLSDQDDLWAANKVEKVIQCFEDTNATVVVHDCRIINENGDIIEPSFFSLRNSGPGLLHNLVKNSYIGCCMAFKRELVDVILPIPDNVPWHDQWIGMISDMVGKSVFLPEILFSYRRHGDNVSSMSHSSVSNMIKLRWEYIVELIKRKKSK